MDADVAGLIERYAARGVIVDTNLLLLYVVDRSDPARIEKFKRTKHLREQDFELLGRFLARFHRRVTTPCILTEVSNFASNLEEPARSRCFTTLSQEISTLDERHEPSSILADDDLFRVIGLTDCSIRRLAATKLLVLTDDYRLANRLVSQNLDAINFNHLRAWS